MGIERKLQLLHQLSADLTKAVFMAFFDFISIQIVIVFSRGENASARRLLKKNNVFPALFMLPLVDVFKAPAYLLSIALA